MNELSKEWRDYIYVVVSLVMILISVGYGIENNEELRSIKQEINDFKREHHVIVEEQFKTTTDTIYIYKPIKIEECKSKIFNGSKRVSIPAQTWNN